MVRRFLVGRHPEGMEKIESYRMEYFVHCYSPAMYFYQDNDHYYMIYQGNEKTGKVDSRMEMTFSSYDHQKNKMRGSLIIKDRYPVPLPDGNAAFVDFYRQPYPGLQFIEVEFEDEEKAAAFQVPDWFGKEMTANKQFDFLQICHTPV